MFPCVCLICCLCVITMPIVSSAVRTGSHPKRWQQQQQQSILLAFCVRRGEMERKTCVQPRARLRSMQAS